MVKRAKQRTDSEPVPDNLNWKRAVTGFLLGVFAGMNLSELGVDRVFGVEKHFLLAAGIAGLLLALTRAYRLLWPLNAILVLCLLVIGYTPLSERLLPRLERRDRLQPAPAVVVLSASVLADKMPSATGQQRLLHGFLLLRQGLARNLILTAARGVNGPAIAGIRRQMQLLGLSYPVIETRPVVNTHDEAVEVAGIAREHGWHQLILVTSPWHMRRAAAVFEKTGLHVLCSPCAENEFDMDDLSAPATRLHAFRDWLHESIGYQVYRLRGWVD
jgi:uncharacterized SAM-binding protein YcdF (DUF218 family)